MSAMKPVLISGGGLASLLLAQSLRQSQIPFTIFERDASFTFRGQGYRLLLAQEGIDAIESILDRDAFQRFWDHCGKTSSPGLIEVNAITGDRTEAKGGGPASFKSNTFVGIARGDMRRIFAEGCEAHIVWSKQVVGYHLTEDGVMAVFEDGSKSIEGSILVAGDGIGSRIAKQLSNGKLKVFDTGARGLYGRAPATSFRGLGEGLFAIHDNDHPGGPIFAITNVRPDTINDPNTFLGWNIGGRPGAIMPPNGKDRYAVLGQEAATLVQELTKNWHQIVRPIFDDIDVPETAFWKITTSAPSGVPYWPNNPRVTVIGDAVHSMTPAGGLGANTAIKDAALLGKMLRDAAGFKPHVTGAYEKEMRVYASEAVRYSYSESLRRYGVKEWLDEETAITV